MGSEVVKLIKVERSVAAGRAWEGREEMPAKGTFQSHDETFWGS